MEYWFSGGQHADWSSSGLGSCLTRFVFGGLWFSVPAIVAGSYIQGGVVMIAGGAVLIYIFRNKKKSIEKEARRQAEIERDSGRGRKLTLVVIT